MSSRDLFWFLSGVLVTIAFALIARAWLRKRPAHTVRAAIPPFAIPVAAALALVGVALGIYSLLGSTKSIASPESVRAPGDAGSLDEVTQRLAARLATQGGSDSEWTLLAQSYDYMGRTAEAKAAREHVASATPPPGESSAALDNQTMAVVANALDNRSATNTGVAAEVIDTAETAGSAEIAGTVQLASRLAAQAAPGATLFIYARQADMPGPPLAVVRLQADRWPVTFRLTDANSMVPGRTLSTAAAVKIEARISRNGDAIPQSGDLVGSVAGVNPREGRPIRISIDREIG